jgi:hypothetical protein
MFIGIASPLLLLFFTMWYDHPGWPLSFILQRLIDRIETLQFEEILVISLAGVEGAINGAIGTLNGLRSINRGFWPIVAFPLLVLVIPLLVFFGDQRSQAGGLFLGVAYGLFALMAGRVGQEVGILGGRIRGQLSN